VIPRCFGFGGERMSKRKLCSWIMCIMVLILSTALVSCGEPEEYSVAVGEVANITYSADKDAVTALSDPNVDIDENGIYTVHGIIIRSEECEKDGKYILAESEEKPDGICFSFEDGVDEEIATGSEIVVKGTFEDVDEIKVLSVESMEVRNQIFPVHKFNSVNKLIASANDYVNKTVSVKGLVDINEDTGSYVISNNKKTRTVVLEKLSEKKKKSLEYGIYRVTGKFYFNDGEATIEVETIKLIEKKEVKEVVTNVRNVETLLRSPDTYLNKKVTFSGILDGAGEVACIWDFSQTSNVLLQGISAADAFAKVNYNRDAVTVEGTFFINDKGEYCITVDKLE